MIMKLFVLVSASALLTASLGFSGDDPVGAAAPDFALKDVYGKEYKLSDFRGRVVVLEWANKDCPVWHKLLKELNDTYKQYVDKDVVWLNIDSTHYAKADDNRVYAVKNDVTKPMLSDADGKVGKAYDARTTPHMFIVDKAGKIVYDGAIDNKAQGDEHVNYVAKALDELLAGKPIEIPRTNPYGCSVKYKR